MYWLLYDLQEYYAGAVAGQILINYPTYLFFLDFFIIGDGWYDAINYCIDFSQEYYILETHKILDISEYNYIYDMSFLQMENLAYTGINNNYIIVTGLDIISFFWVSIILSISYMLNILTSVTIKFPNINCYDYISLWQHILYDILNIMTYEQVFTYYIFWLNIFVLTCL